MFCSPRHSPSHKQLNHECSIHLISWDGHMMYWCVEAHIDMWQSYVEEIKDYSITYFDCVTTLVLPYHWAFVKGRTHTRFVDLLDITHLQSVWALLLTEVQWHVHVRHFEHSDAFKISSRIILDFYTGLSHFTQRRITKSIYGGATSIVAHKLGYK